MGVVFFLIFIGFFALIIKMGIDRAKKIRATWKGFAEAHGYQFSGETLHENPQITGQLGGVPFTIATEVHGSGKNRHTYTRYRAHFSARLPDQFSVFPENFGSSVAKFFGGQDIEIGDGVVDGALRIRGSNESDVREFFADPAIRDAVLAFVGEGGRIEQGDATFLTQGTEQSQEVLQGRLQSAVELVQAVQGEPSSSATAWENEQTEDVFAAVAGPIPESEARPDEESPQQEPAEPTEPATSEEPVTPEPPASEEPVAAGTSMSGACIVERVVWTTSPNVSGRVAGGQSVVGTLEDGRRVEVAFPRERDAEIKRLRRGDTIQIAGTVVEYDTYDRRAVVEAE